MCGIYLSPGVVLTTPLVSSPGSEPSLSGSELNIDQQPKPVPIDQQSKPVPIDQQSKPVPIDQQSKPVPIDQQPKPVPIDQQPKPGPIDNSVLCEPDILDSSQKKLPSLTNEGGLLKHTLVEGRDFVPLPEEVWKVFTLWYGTADTTFYGPSLPRKVSFYFLLVRFNHALLSCSVTLTQFHLLPIFLPSRFLKMASWSSIQCCSRSIAIVTNLCISLVGYGR